MSNSKKEKNAQKAVWRPSLKVLHVIEVPFSSDPEYRH